MNNFSVSNMFNNIKNKPELQEKFNNKEKTIKGMYEYVYEKARALQQGNVAMVNDQVVYLWATNYFKYTNEELGIKKEEKTINPIVSSVLNKNNNQTIENNESSKEEVKESIINNNDVESNKPTYSKSDIFKKTVFIPTTDEDLKTSIEKSKFEQKEIDKAIENAVEIDDDTPVEAYQNYSNKKLKELEEKDIKIIETEEELKTSTVIPEIEKKPVEPYKVPEHSIENDEKKSNKLIPIIGIIIIILGLSFLGFQFLTSKNDNNDDGFYNIVTNENVLSNENINEMTNDYDDLSDISNINAMSSNQNNLISNQNDNANKITNNIVTNNTPTNNIVTNNQINKITNDTQAKTNNIQTNTAVVKTNTINTNVTPPKEPELPNPPVIPDPPTPPATQNNNTQNNTVSYIDGNVYKTKWTDTLTSIATKELGDARKWPMIFAANDNIFTDPDKIVFNVNIKIPNDGKKKIEDMNQTEKKNLYDAYMKVADRYIELGKTNMANIVRNAANNIK